MSNHPDRRCQIGSLLQEVAQARAFRWKDSVVLWLRSICALTILFCAQSAAVPTPTPARPLQVKEAGPAGLEFELDATEAETLEAVRIVAEDTTIRGTYVYEKEKTLTGALSADSSAYFGPWQGPGRVFYKVLTGALAPRHFKDSSDMGTITVRYVVQAKGESRTRLRIDAVFVQAVSRKAANSDGSVEASEFKEIQDRLQHIQSTNRETAALLKKRQEEDEKAAASVRERQEETARLETAESSLKGLDSRYLELRRKVVVKIKNENTEMKSAPFHSATSVETLKAGAELVILIVTPSWLGVETVDSRRGWLRQDQVEPIP